MKTTVRLLIAEPSEEDASRVAETLAQGGVDTSWERIDTVTGAEAALAREAWDIVLVDEQAVGLPISTVQEILKRKKLDIPCILLVDGDEKREAAVPAGTDAVPARVNRKNLQELIPAMEGQMNRSGTLQEHRKIAEALRESEERYRLHFESLNDVIYSVNRDMILTDVSPSIRTHLGYLPEELIGKPFSELNILTPESLEQAVSDIRQIFTGEKVSAGEYVFLARDGSDRFGEVNNTPVVKEGKIIGATAVARDITERKRLEEQLHQSQKMEAIGRLAGGVAHDFNNLLTAITGYTDLLLITLEPGSDSCGFAKEIHNALEHASSLTHHLLAFSRKQLLRPESLNLNAVVSGMQKMLGRLIGEDIEMVPVLSPDIGTVRVDPGQVEQVIMNLVLNARDAMPEGGRLTLETEDAFLDENDAQQYLELRPGPYVVLTVRDTGCGMEEEILSQIFEPFFTTKKGEKGSGLGLSTVYGIIKQSGGHISVESEPWKGTSFRIHLPWAEVQEAKTGTGAAPFPTLKGSETILLVEDDPSVRSLVLKVLQRNGYKVLEAANPGEAILISEQHTGLIHLMVTDVVMPRMSAPELSERLAPWHPEMKVLYVSGYTDSQVVREGVLLTDLPFLQKPFSPETLLRAVRQVLTSPRKARG
jgi:two-component system cell cycle sensor histidine kinase/response regulator CckA